MRTVLSLLFTICFAASITAQQINSTGFELYKRLAKEGQKNIFFSPYSVNAALFMAYAGASGDTQKAFERALNLSSDKTQNLSEYAKYEASFLNVKAVQLSVANQFSYNSKMAVHDAYLKNLEQFNARSEAFDFINRGEETRLKINQMIAEATQNKIRDILPERSIDDRARFVLTNAVYFRGGWESTFNPATNTEEYFAADNGEQYINTFIHQKSMYGYTENAVAQILELKYKKGTMSMLIILPKLGKNIAEVEATLNDNTYQKWVESMVYKQVQVSIPKFNMESEINLKGYLYSMGLEEAFAEKANFSDMSSEDAYLTDVFHKSFIEVNENGTEASAATAVIGMSKGIAPNIPIFKANRPFFYLIKENMDNQILFMGRFSTPTQKNTAFNKSINPIENASSDENIHIVKKGETVFQIAKKYNKNVDDISKMNGLIDFTVFEGQRLILDETMSQKGIEGELITARGIEEKITKPTDLPSEIPVAYNSNSLFSKNIHEVKAGETLYSIARQYEISVDKLMVLNGLNNNEIQLGEVLKINEKAFKTTTYTVKSGDSLSKIAKVYQTTVPFIKALNELEGDLIFIGQELKISTQKKE